MRFAVTIWGIRLRAIGENPGIAMDLGVSASGMTIQALALANGTVGLAGALFAQRSYSADISMGIGMTITGLAGMTLGLVVAGNDAGPGKSLAMIVVGAIVYKALVFLALEIGAPGEAFRLLSSAVILLGFLLAARSRSDFLRGLRWN
jgi:putative ABC transport system permease protein